MSDRGLISPSGLVERMGWAAVFFITLACYLETDRSALAAALITAFWAFLRWMTDTLEWLFQKIDESN